MRLLKAKIKTTGEIKEGYLSKKPDDCFLVPVDHNEFEYYNLNSVELMGCAVKPTMPVIVARLCPS